MTAEKWSAVLEIVSFFLVTIDLFGKTRLIELQKRVNELANDLKSRELAKSFWHRLFNFFDEEENDKKKSVNRSSEEIKGCLGLFFFLLIGPFLALYYEKLHIWFLLSFLLAFLSVYALIIMLGFLLDIIIRSLEFFLDSFLSGIIFLITKFNLQGLMLVTGAILFLISKAIILFN